MATEFEVNDVLLEIKNAGNGSVNIVRFQYLKVKKRKQEHAKTQDDDGCRKFMQQIVPRKEEQWDC